jgi:AcrR family transcriptional regulator
MCSQEKVKFVPTKNIKKQMPRLSKKEKADETRTALMMAARELLIAEGLQAISVRGVAVRAGYTTMAVYSYFGGKEGIVGALFDEGFAHLATAQQAVPLDLAPATRLLRLCQAYRQIAQRFPHHYDLMLGPQSGSHTPSKESARSALATLDCLIAAAGAFLGRGRSAQARDLAVSLFAFAHGWVSLERSGAIPAIGGKNASFDAAVNKLVSR